MKKIFTLSMAVMLAVCSFGQTQRTVVFELFSGENCPPCAAYNPYVYALINQYPSEVLLVHYMAPIPSTGTLCQEDPTDEANRFEYYAGSPNNESTPWGEQDGTIWDSTLLNTDGYSPITWCVNNSYQIDPTYLDAEYAIPSPFTIAVWDTFTSSTDSFYASVTVTAAEAVSMSGLKLQMAMVEDLTYPAPIGNNGETFFPHVVRKMYPSTTGTALSSTWTNGQVTTYNFQGKVPVYVRDKSALNFIAFIQDNSTQKVQQAAITNPFTFNLDVATTGVVGNFANCNSSQYTPVINLTNTGTTAIITCYIQETIDNVFIDSVPWSGNLPVGNSVNVQLAPLNITQGQHTLKFTITSPNAVADPNPGNNTATIALDIPDTSSNTPLVQGFENGAPSGQGWEIYTADHDSTWRVVSTGDASANSLMLDYYDDLYADFVGPVDFLYSPPLNLTYTAHAKVTFDRASQRINFGGGEYSDDSLSIDVSMDCGDTWTNVYEKDGIALASTTTTQSVNSANPFTPTSTQWAADSADISAVSNHENVLLRFRTTNGDGNNLYLDNINITTSDSVPYTPPTGIISLSNLQSVVVYPNPANDMVSVNVQLSQATEVSYQLIDVTGKTVATVPAHAAYSGQNIFSLNTSSLAEGNYIMTVTAGSDRVSKVVAVTHR